MVTVVRWTGREARALREALRMSVRAFAGHTNLSVATIADLEAKGEHTKLRNATQRILDEVLASAPQEAQRRFVLLCDEAAQSSPTANAVAEVVPRPFRPPAGSVPDGSTSRTQVGIIMIGTPRPATIVANSTGEEVEDTKRRQVLAWMLSATAGASLSEVDERLPAGTVNVDRRLLVRLREGAESLASLYRSADPRATLPAAASYADNLLNLYSHQAGGRYGRDLAVVAVEVHCQVGLWACHARELPQARRYLASACEVAAEIDHPPLYARALGALSYLHSSAPRGGAGGNPRRTLELLNRALTLASKVDGFTRGWLATWRADQHATTGNLPAARADIETADRALDLDTDGAEQGFFARRHYGYGMRGHLDSVRGLVHTLAGELDQAEQTFQLVQNRAANDRRRVASLGHQALGLARARRPEPAAEALARSTTLAVDTAYPMGVQRALGVRAGFDPVWADLPCVRDLDQQLLPVASAAG